MMRIFNGGKAPEKTTGEEQSFRITRVKVMEDTAAKINAEMFQSLDAKAEHPARPVVGADCNGAKLLETVVDFPFIHAFHEKSTESVSVMTRCGFLPLGIAADGADGNNDTLYVLVNKDNVEKQPPPLYMPNEIYRGMTAVLAEHVQRVLPLKLVPVDSTVVNRVIDFIYYRVEIRSDVVDEGETVKALSVDVQLGETGVIAMARAWFREALNRKVSDIHIEPMDKGVGRIRFRIDGRLEVVQEGIMVSDLQQIVTWVKAQSRMDISERRRPLDGTVRISYMDNSNERLVDVRVSTIPTAFGQKMVMRLLDPYRLSDLSKLGLKGTIWDEGMCRTFDNALNVRDGIVLVTGPTGSGKTSTLNVALLHLLNEVCHDEKNIATIEDPIEYNIPRANQTQINDAAGVTFANMLRALLRQDPDIILVGEIRDPETARIAVQAALTGHLILATLHTNDALGSVDRLKDLGISPFLIGSTLRLAQAQRLIRTLCPECGKVNRLEGETLATKVGASKLNVYRDLLLAPTATIYAKCGCSACNGKGYKGRKAVMEMVPTSPGLVKAIEEGLSSRQLCKVSKEYGFGFEPMLRNGVDMICAGVTSLDEVEQTALATNLDE